MTAIDSRVLDELRKISSPTIANAIETFNVRPRSAGNVGAEILCRFPRLGPLVGYAVTAVVRAEPAPLEGHRANEAAWWDHVAASPGPRVVVMHDLDEPRGQGAYWGEVQARRLRRRGRGRRPPRGGPATRPPRRAASWR